ncbi:MAG: DUF4097 family beta strand repeat protein [Verrucomicrobiae bacterium]|nr:DUF4097 family beta strand repeat protein [Verrucomicrobiae bacterium]
MKRNPAPISATALVAVLSVLGSGSVLAADSERIESRELTAAAGGTLTFKAVSGSVEVKTHDRDVVAYEAVLKPGRLSFGDKVVDLLEFDYTESDGNVRIGMRWKDGKSPKNANLQASHTVWVPARYHVDVRTAGGGIRGSDLQGRVVAQTSGGSIQWQRVEGDLEAQTSGGNITVDAIRGRVKMTTSGGTIQADHVDGDLTGTTSGGSIKLNAIHGTIRAQTAGGSINAGLSDGASGPVVLSTSGGSIRLTVPGDFKADLRAATSGGRVSCDLPVQGTIKGSSVVGQVNGGGPEVSLNTSGGSIHVAKR